MVTHVDAAPRGVVGRPDLLAGPGAAVGQTAMSPAPAVSGLIRAARAAAVVVALAAVLATAVFWVGGGRWFVVRTASMGQAAPVGTLVLTRPVNGDDLRMGQVIAFRPPTSPTLTYTHRIVSISGSGTARAIRTKGDINGAVDGWTLHPQDVVGRAVAIVPGVGWLLRALPMLVVGSLVVLGIARLWLRPSVRGPFMMVGLSMVFSLTVTILKPFIGISQIATSAGANGTLQVGLVSTGLLPVRVATRAGHGHAVPVDLHAGQVGVAVLSDPPADGKFALVTHLHLSWLGWTLIALVWSLPMVWSILSGFRSRASRRTTPVTSQRAARSADAVTS